MILRLLVPLLCCTVPLSAQLPEADRAFLRAMREKLGLDALQDSMIVHLYRETQTGMDSLDRCISALELTSADEEQVTREVPVLRRKKQDLREWRELQIRQLLLPAQRNIYDTELRPEKPAVLHFGVHDRMNCVICNK